jgi:hypothetical protein
MGGGPRTTPKASRADLVAVGSWTTEASFVATVLDLRAYHRGAPEGMMMQHLRIAMLLVAVALMAGSAYGQPAYTFTKIADSSEDGSIAHVFDLNNMGQVAFTANSQVFRGDGQIRVLIGSPANPCNYLAMNDAGLVVFIEISESNVAQARFGSGGDLSPPVVIPGEECAGAWGMGLNDSGHAAIRHDPSGSSCESVGVLSATGLVDVYFANCESGEENILGVGPMNDSGQIPFLRLGSGYYEIARLDQNGTSVTPIYVFPASSGVYGDLDMNSSGAVAWIEQFASPNAWALRASDGGPAQSPLESPVYMEGPLINDHGDVASQVGSSLIFRPAGGDPVTVADGSTTLDGSTVVGVITAPGNLNNRGQIAFRAGLQDGRTLLVRADPIAVVPTMSTGWLVVLGTTLCASGALAVARRRRTL